MVTLETTTERIPLSPHEIWRLSVLARMPARQRSDSAMQRRYFEPLSEGAKKIGRVLLGESADAADSSARRAAAALEGWAKRNTRPSTRGRARRAGPRLSGA